MSFGGSGGQFDLITSDFPSDYDTFEDRLKNVTRNPNEMNIFHGPAGSVLSKSEDELTAEKSELTSKIAKAPALPEEGSESARLRKKAAAGRAKRRTGRQASIKTSSRGLPEDDQLNIARATLVG